MQESLFKIEISHLTKHYGKTVGIQDLTLNIRHGEIFGFLGPNGAGKTTTIRCLLNILIPTSGAIKIDQIAVSRDTSYLKDEIGYLPSENFFPKGFSVNNLLDYIGSLRRKPSLRREELIQRFNLPLNKQVHALSHGNKQKLGIVLAFMHDPSLLIMDEPSSGLDPLAQQDLYAFILEEKAKGKTIFFSSHNLDEVQKICDRIGIIREGELIAVEPVKALSEKVVRTFITIIEDGNLKPFEDAGIPMTKKGDELHFPITDRRSLNQILKILSTMQVIDISYPPASLEEFFLQYYN